MPLRYSASPSSGRVSGPESRSAPALVDARGRQAQHPADIGRGDEVPRRPQHVGPQDLSAREGVLHVGIGAVTDALAERPLRFGEFLRLDRPEPSHRLGRALEGIAGQPLLVQPPAYDDQAVHHSRRGSA